MNGEARGVWGLVWSSFEATLVVFLRSAWQVCFLSKLQRLTGVSHDEIFPAALALTFIIKMLVYTM